MHLYPRRQKVAAQVAKELKTVTYITPPMEERSIFLKLGRQDKDSSSEYICSPEVFALFNLSHNYYKTHLFSLTDYSFK